MKRDHEEIVELLAKVQQFCVAVGKQPLGVRDTLGRAVDDRLLLGVPQMDMACEAIHLQVAFAARLANADHEPERERMLADSELRLAVALESLRGLLYQARASKTAFELSVQVGRAAAKAKAGSRIGAEAKRENAASRTRQLAAFWNHECSEHPSWSADKIAQEVRAKAKCSQRTLDRHLAAARELGLIEARHGRPR